MATCPFCTWSDHSYRLPYHLITHHIEHIRLAQGNNGHCVRAYYRRGGEDVDFCVCLTCHKGIMNDGTAGHGAKWITTHSKKAGCVAAHPQVMRDLRARMSPEPTYSPTAPQPPPPKNDSFADLWTKWKSNTKTLPAMNSIEDRCKAEFEFDNDEGLEYMFDPKSAFEQCILMVQGLLKDNEHLKGKITHVEQTNDRKVTELSRELYSTRSTLATIKENYNTLFEAHQQLMAQSKALTDENKQLKEENELIKLENKRLSDRLDIVEEENKQVKEENKILNERLVVMEEENKRMKERLDALEAL